MSNGTVYQNVGNAVAQWEDASPLRWTMREPARKGGMKSDPIECNLSALLPAYEEAFLLALKDVLIASRHRVQLPTIASTASGLRLLLEKVYTRGIDAKSRVRKIDSGFLVALHAAADEIPATYLAHLKRLYQSHRNDGRIFESGLQPGDFPRVQSKRGALGDQIHRILAKALSRSTLVHVLDVMEASFEQGRIDLGRYAFTRLALNVFCRPDGYRRLTLADLRKNKNSGTGAVSYYLDIFPSKKGTHNPKKIAYGLHPEVGRLLEMQRQAVVEKCGHLAPITDGDPELGQLALFPALTLSLGGTEWVSPYANAHAGILERASFAGAYIDPVKAQTHAPLSFNALRHTIGTQLAQMGCSAHTIQAVLKHSTDTVCVAYVDIAFHGLIDELSDGLKPGFDEHFPVINNFTTIDADIPPERRIISEDIETVMSGTTGMCGRQVACSYAPITCYACPRFIPCYDADHSINLNVVDREISAFEGKGLAMQHDVKRWKTIRNSIRIVITACDNKRRALEMQAATAGEESA